MATFSSRYCPFLDAAKTLRKSSQAATENYKGGRKVHEGVQASFPLVSCVLLCIIITYMLCKKYIHAPV